MRKRINDKNRVHKHFWDGLVVEVLLVNKETKQSKVRLPGTNACTWISNRKLERLENE